MKVLIACEESQAICKAFREAGHEAFSCDILPCSGGHPGWHLQGDVFNFVDRGWDLMIAHPPCTYLSVSGAKWYYHPEDNELPFKERRPHPRFPDRRKHQQEGLDFVQKLMDVDIPRIAIENPISVISSRIRKPDQIIQPWMFGDEAMKSTCLWLKNLPKIKPTKIVGKGEMVTYGSGKRMQKWYVDALTNSKTAEERRTMRSKTFPGMAKAIAEQWGNVPYTNQETKNDRVNDVI